MASSPATKTIAMSEPGPDRMGFLWPGVDGNLGPHSSEAQKSVESVAPGPCVTCNSVMLWSSLYWPLSTDPHVAIIPPGLVTVAHNDLFTVTQSPVRLNEPLTTLSSINPW